MHELRFSSPEWLGNVATEPPSLLFPPLFIFGNEKQPEVLKKNLYSLSQIQEDTNRCCVARPCPPTAHDNLLTAFQKGSNLPLGTIWGEIQLLLRTDITTVWNNSKCIVFVTWSVMIDHHMLSFNFCTHCEILHSVQVQNSLSGQQASQFYVIIIEGIIFQ